MVRIICPNCQKVHNVSPMTDDFICNCAEGTGNIATAREDVLVIGKWEDFSGSGGSVTQMVSTRQNTLQGTKSEIEGGDVEDRTRRGNKVITHRQRDHLQFIDVK